MPKSHLAPTVFLVLLLVFVVALAAHNFDRYYLTKNYPLHVFTACSAAEHNCFVADPETADPTFQGEPYAKVEINAAQAPTCLDEHTCSNFSCANLTNCSISYCSKETLEDGEHCSDSTAS